jgi:formylglycine-generating enzyme required for sulfatase activity
MSRTFLLDQPLFRLKAGSPDARWLAVLTESEPIDALRKQEGFEPAFRSMPPGHVANTVPEKMWEKVVRTNLIDMMCDPPNDQRRVALICSGGLGKTTNLGYFADAINAGAKLNEGTNKLEPTYHGRQLAFVVPFAQLLLPLDQLRDWLLRQIKETVPGTTEQLEADLNRRLLYGRITFLLDSLDQAGPDPKGLFIPRLESLCTGIWKKCPIWVSGRPHAFEPNKRLFFNGWQFYQVGQLDKAETRYLLDVTRVEKEREMGIPNAKPANVYGLLSPSAKKLAQVPRIGRLIGRLPPKRVEEKLSGNATRADVYWEVYNFTPADADEESGILYDGLKTVEGRMLGWRLAIPPKRPTNHQLNRARDLLAAIAFEMLARKDSKGNPDPAFEGIPLSEEFQNEVKQRFLNAGALLGSDKRPEASDYFDVDWEIMQSMDSVGLKHFVFTTDARDKSLRWADITTMSFFAAYWACRWGSTNPDDLDTMTRWILDPLEKTNEEFREFWEFALDMPREEIDPARWERLFGQLYKFREVRSTEFLYRSWKQMAEVVTNENYLQNFLAEFPAILNGEPRAKATQIARKMMLGEGKSAKEGNAFITSAAKGSTLPDDTGTFMMGASPEDAGADEDEKPQHEIALSRFKLHRYCVTNLEYELFCKDHNNQRWDGGQHPLVKAKREGADDDCPVVNVSWYDAWVFAAWCGCVLPTEAQWEYACRAGLRTPFSFQNHDGLTCTADVCNFDGNYPYPGSQAEKLKSETPVAIRYRECTMPVHGKDGNPEMHIEANRWGFFQMHGNVDEWCHDWYDGTYYQHCIDNKLGMDPQCPDSEQGSRTVRGGSWSYLARGCRASRRDGGEPGDRSRSCGFRLASCLDFG